MRLLTASLNIRYIQVGIVQGGVWDCGDSRYPGIYIRLDDPDILEFIHNVASPRLAPSVVEVSSFSNPETLKKHFQFAEKFSNNFRYVLGNCKKSFQVCRDILKHF